MKPFGMLNGHICLVLSMLSVSWREHFIKPTLHIIESPVERPLAQVDRVPVPTRPWLERVELVLGVGVVPTLLQLRRGEDPRGRAFVPIGLRK